MKVEIFIVSFLRDAEFLRYCLKSIDKFATGFSGVTVVIPNRDVDAMRWVKQEFGARLCGFDEAPNKGMLHHEYQKIIADKWYSNGRIHLSDGRGFVLLSDLEPV